MSRARKGRPSAAAMASTVPPRSTTATSSTGSAPASARRAPPRAASAPGDGVLGHHHPVAGIEGAGDPAAAAVVLGLLAHAERLEQPPAGGGHPGGDEGHRVGPHGQPPDGGGSSGITDSTASATSTMASGRHTVCFESMNQLLCRPDLRTKSPRLHRVVQQVATAAPRTRWRAAGRSPRLVRCSTGLGPAGGLRPAPRPVARPLDPAHHRGRPPRRRRSAPRASSTRSGSTTMTMPSPRLKTRAISSSATSPRRRISPKIGGTVPRPPVDHGAAALGQDPGQVAREPAPGDVGHGVDPRPRGRWRPARPGRR